VRPGSPNSTCHNTALHTAHGSPRRGRGLPEQRCRTRIGCAPYELSCWRGCRKAHPGRAGDRRAEAGLKPCPRCEAAVDTRLVTCPGRRPSGRRSFRKQRTVNPLTGPRAVEGAGRLFFTPSRPACGRPPAAAVLGRRIRRNSLIPHGTLRMDSHPRLILFHPDGRIIPPSLRKEERRDRHCRNLRFAWRGRCKRPSGALIDANLSNGKESRPIHGTCNAATNQLLFNDAQFPGEILFTTFYTGYAILADNEVGRILGLAGTWQQQKLKFDPSRRIIELEN
jgi:hypothetical protein